MLGLKRACSASQLLGSCAGVQVTYLLEQWRRSTLLVTQLYSVWIIHNSYFEYSYAGYFDGRNCYKTRFLTVFQPDSFYGAPKRPILTGLKSGHSQTGGSDLRGYVHAGTFNMPTPYRQWVWERKAYMNWSMVPCQGSTRSELP